MRAREKYKFTVFLFLAHGPNQGPLPALIFSRPTNHGKYRRLKNRAGPHVRNLPIGHIQKALGGTQRCCCCLRKYLSTFSGQSTQAVGSFCRLTSCRYSMPSTTSLTILTRPADRSGCGRCLSSSRPPPPLPRLLPPPVSRSRSPSVPFARKSYTRETWCGEATHTPRKPQMFGCRSLRTMCFFF